MVTRKDQISLNYTFVHFEFPRAFGASDIHQVGVHYRHQIGRSWTLSAGVGAYRVETLGAQTVALSPEVAAILGQTSGIQAVYRINYAPSFEANVLYARRQSNFSAGYTNGVSPGNGIFLTSRTESASAGYGYSGIRKASLSASSGYTRFGSLYQQIGNLSSFQAGVSASYLATEHLSLTVAGDVRTYTVQTGSTQVGRSLTVGVAWSPSRVPLPSF
jgi:hypothetical protein